MIADARWVLKTVFRPTAAIKARNRVLSFRRWCFLIFTSFGLLGATFFGGGFAITFVQRMTGHGWWIAVPMLAIAWYLVAVLVIFGFQTRGQ